MVDEGMICTDQRKISNSLEITFLTIRKVKREDFLQKIQIAVCSRKFAKKLIELNPPNLKFIQLTSAGYDGLNLKLLKSRNVMISNAKGVYGGGMAEFVVHSLLESAKRYNRDIKNKRIRLQRNYKYISELSGKTVTILGVGEIGSEVAKRLSAFDMQVLGFAQKSREIRYFKQVFDTVNDLNRCLTISDYVISTLPYTNETAGFLDKDIFSVMKKNCVFMNVGRRETIKEMELYHFLKSNRDFTAILDIFERFPNAFTNRFRRLNNVLVLPGITAVSREIEIRKINLASENIDLILNNRMPKFLL